MLVKSYYCQMMSSKRYIDMQEVLKSMVFSSSKKKLMVFRVQR